MPSFYDRFVDSANRFPAQIAVELQHTDPARPATSHTYAELRQMSECVGQWLLECGMAKGARCSIIAANSPRWVASYFGAMAAGGVAVPLDTAFSAEQIAKLLVDSGSSFVFTDQAHLEVASEAVAKVKEKVMVQTVLLDGASGSTPALDQILANRASGFSAVAPSDDDLAVILYTSGTTSDPKGVMLTHANLAAEAQAVFASIDVGERDTILGVLPLFHALAQMANLLLPYSVGMRVVYLEQLNTTELLRALSERGITLFACVPQFFYLIHEKVMKQVNASGAAKRIAFRFLMKLAAVGRAVGVNLGKLLFAQVHRNLGSKMRYFVTGGSRFEPQVGKDLEALGFDILQAYGLTECSGAATLSRPGERFNGSVGKALPQTEVRVVDADMQGEQAGSEIAIRGGIVMKGYFNRPDATAAVLQDGWLLTGDLGRIDRNGDIFITGRKKDVIVLSSGKNIYPEEIEAHYIKSPWIKEIAVMGLQSRPGEPISERLHAVIVPDMDVLREKKIVNMREVIRFDVETLSAQVPSTKRILSYDIWQSELPRTTTRKLKRFQIQQLVEQKKTAAEDSASGPAKELSADEALWAADPVVARALRVIRAAAKDKAVHPADNLELDLGLDSMERVELVVALEHELKAKADESSLSEVYTVRELVETVRRGQGQADARAQAGWKDIFATESDDPEVLALAEPRTLSAVVWYALQRLVRPIIKFLFRTKVSGLEKLPKTGPFILSPNHQSYLDGPIVTSQLPYRIFKDLFFVGTSEVFGDGLMRKLAGSMRVVPVDPDANLVPAMRAGSFGLKRGKILVLYPEGERSIDGTLKTFKKGAAILAVHHNVPIVPVAIEGFFEVWPRGFGFKGFHPLQIAFGEPILPPADASTPEAAYEQMTKELKNKVFEMWQPLHAKNEEKGLVVGANA